jgi:hypothetical protein
MIFKKKEKQEKEHTLLSQIAKYVTAALVLLVLYLAVYRPRMPRHTKGKFEK